MLFHLASHLNHLLRLLHHHRIKHWTGVDLPQGLGGLCAHKEIHLILLCLLKLTSEGVHFATLRQLPLLLFLSYMMMK